MKKGEENKGQFLEKREERRRLQGKKVSFEKEGFLPFRRERFEGLQGPDFGFLFVFHVPHFWPFKVLSILLSCS